MQLWYKTRPQLQLFRPAMPEPQKTNYDKREHIK